jgi:hypothetical protein
MSDAVALTIQQLLDDAGVQAALGDRIDASVAPEDATFPYAVVYLVGQAEDLLVNASSSWPESRVSVQICTRSAGSALSIGETVIAALRDKINVAPVTGYEATFRKGGSDVTDYSDDRTVHRRIIDFYIRWRDTSP